MSDESAEGSPSNRPGTNADTSANSGQSGRNEGQEKSGRKRRRKPRNRKRKGIQANMDGTLDAANSAARATASPGTGESSAASSSTSAKSDSGNSPFDDRRSSKRARRRRGRRGGKRREDSRENNGKSANQTTPETGNQLNTADPGEGGAGQRKRQTRRPGREKTGNIEHDHGHNRRHVKKPDQPAKVTSAKRGADPNNTNRKSRAELNGKSNGQPAGRRHNRQNGKGRPQSPAASQVPLRRRDAYAALDLGTNNCRLLVAVPQQPGRFQVIDAFSRIVRLGEGLASSGRLNDAAMDRAVEALKACSDKLANRTVKGVRLIATEACRRADNGAEFLQRVETEAGLKLEIVDRETEARLAVAGCSSLVDRKAKGAVLFDIGGGSSELALLDLRKRKRHDLSKALVSWTSLPHGVVTLSEKHGGGKHVTREVFDNMVDEISHLLQGFEGRDELAEAGNEGEVHLLGTSGTVTTLAGIHLKLPRYDRRQVDGIWMVSKDVDAMIDALVEMDFEQRIQNPCIGRERADLVLAGCAILVAIQKLWPCPRLRVADRGLREGLLTEMMNADNAWQRRPHRPNRWRR